MVSYSSDRKPPRALADATDAELAVLESLWAAGALRVRELAEDLYSDAGASSVATVQKLLDRLAAKGIVDRRKEGRSYVYRPKLDRRKLVLARLRATAEALCGGSIGSLLTHLVEGGELDSGELQELRRLVGDSDRPSTWEAKE